MGVDFCLKEGFNFVWSPTGKARGTSIEIPSYAKASEGYPPVAKSTEASSNEHPIHLAAFYAFIHGQSPVVFCVGGQIVSSL